MTLRIELEVEITGDCSFEEAENFFLYAFAGYSLSDWENNPLINEESDAEYDVTNIKIEEV
jgi:hypothetical protein